MGIVHVSVSGCEPNQVDWTFFLLFWLARLVVGTVYHYHVQTTPNLD